MQQYIRKGSWLDTNMDLERIRSVFSNYDDVIQIKKIWVKEVTVYLGGQSVKQYVQQYFKAEDKIHIGIMKL